MPAQQCLGLDEEAATAPAVDSALQSGPGQPVRERTSYLPAKDRNLVAKFESSMARSVVSRSCR
jgi:hypothetical protein